MLTRSMVVRSKERVPSREALLPAAASFLSRRVQRAALLGLLLIASGGYSARAAPIFDNFDGVEISIEGSAASTLLTRIEVEDSDVPISGLGIYGDLLLDGNAKAVIFAAPSALPVTPSTPLTRLFVSDAVTVGAAGSAQWYDVTGISFTLAADTDYYLGIVFDQDFGQYWDGIGSSTQPRTQNGITTPENAWNGLNGIVENFASPTARSAGNVLASLRIYGVPEPSTLSLIGVGLLAISLFQRQGRERPRCRPRPVA